MRLRSSVWLVMIGARAALGQVDTSAWPQVRLDVTATDKAGAPLVLTSNTLVLQEGGRAVPVVTVTAAAEPQSVCVVLDASGSMYGRRVEVQAAAERMIDALPADDQVCVVDFSAQSFVDVTLTLHRAVARKWLANYRVAGGSALYDTLVSVGAYLQHEGKFKSHAIVLFTDGDDNMSKTDLPGAITKLYAAGAPAIHVFRLSGPDADHADTVKGEKTATALARATGGIAYFPARRGELEAAVDELGRAMANRFTLSYESAAPARDGAVRHVSVELDKSHQKQKAALFAAEGYYAPSH